VSSVASHRVSNVSTSQSHLNVWPPNFYFSAGTTDNGLPTNFLDIFAFSVGFFTCHVELFSNLPLEIRTGILPAVIIQTLGFYVTTVSIFIGKCQHFEGICCLHFVVEMNTVLMWYVT
jgi:hypothetical protein